MKRVCADTYIMIFMEMRIQAALILCIAIVITTYYMFSLAFHYRAVGHYFTEVVYVDVFKPIRIP
jgi:hypothetical protein